MKTIYFLVLSVFIISSTAIAQPCISTQQANAQSIASSPEGNCDSNGQCSLPSLAEGWQWIREYEISYEEPTPWHWRSWPDGKRLTICK